MGLARVFQSTHPVRGATRDSKLPPAAPSGISIHAPRAGCDQETPKTPDTTQISIHAPRAGCDIRHPQHHPGVKDISIHAPRAGCDAPHVPQCRRARHFNPRTPCGVRHGTGQAAGVTAIFQSTHPVRGATQSKLARLKVIREFQSTHPVRGATHIAEKLDRPSGFQSTHPVRGATKILRGFAGYRRISIHAPRAGCDVQVLLDLSAFTISIHAPRAGCDIPRGRPSSTPTHISIHAPRAGCDARRVSITGHLHGFQSTHPVRGATFQQTIAHGLHTISIHAPRAGCDAGRRSQQPGG